MNKDEDSSRQDMLTSKIEIKNYQQQKHWNKMYGKYHGFQIAWGRKILKKIKHCYVPTEQCMEKEHE